MTFTPDLAEIRFGCGLSPVVAPPASVSALLEGVTGADDMAARFPVQPFPEVWQRFAEYADLRSRQRDATDTTRARELDSQARNVLAGVRHAGQTGFLHVLLRWSHTRQGLRERLAFFWTDHFTALGKTPILRNAGLSYAEDAIRPNMAGRFADLLIAAVTHPLMLNYLDQAASVGPSSPAALRKEKRRGLNENLAREVMELHTLGVDGPYTQDDVRQLAELFTGLSLSREDGFVFRAGMAEPGPETVLGRAYGGDPATLESVHAVLADLSVHPATARHMARKLAVHLVADLPDPDLVDHVAARWQATGGDLKAVYGALVEHPAAWVPVLSNVKPPADFVASTCRALAIAPETMAGLPGQVVRQNLMAALGRMGQPWLRPAGPDGWPEADTAWITPQGLAARLDWAMNVPVALRPDLPDPRVFVQSALGGFAGDGVRFAAMAAETRAEAIGLVLASPDFQRR